MVFKATTDLPAVKFYW